MRLSMWSGPRNVSTALMYAFRQRSDTEVFDEPLYGHYLATTGADHPAAQEVMDQMETDGARVVHDVLLAEPSPDRPVRFYKNMAHHLRGLDRGFLDGMTHLLLTRDPREMLPSLAHQLPHPTLADTGYPEQIELLEREEAAGRAPVVLDARELLLDPEGVLREACRRLGLPFEPAMLRWPVGPKPEDGVWAPRWYANVHASTGFAPYRPKTAPFPECLRSLLEACRPYYERLRAHALDARGPDEA
jgi:hypothetical protein